MKCTLHCISLVQWRKSSGRPLLLGSGYNRSLVGKHMNSASTPKDFEDALGKLNADYFFREFTFSSNTFGPEPTKELELANKVVWLDDLVIVYQVKERAVQTVTSAEKERKWFESVVMDQGTRQIRDTLTYLNTYPQINLQNNRGDSFDVSIKTLKPHKLVIYYSHPSLPEDCLLQKYHYSKTAGVIHVLHWSAYFEILNTLVTPIEIAEYFAYREALASRFRKAIEKVSEKALLGHYLRNLPEEAPGPEFEALVDKLVEQDKDWDMSHMIHVFRERRTTTGSLPQTEYTVLKSLAKLYRTDMAEFKKRFRFSMDKALGNETCLPHRFSSSTNCGFVFIPLRREDLPYRLNLLLNYTALNKYDQKLDKCIGLTFIAEDGGKSCDVQWCPMEFTWEENPKLQAALDAKNPFRPVKEPAISLLKMLDIEYQNLHLNADDCLVVRRLI